MCGWGCIGTLWIASPRRVTLLLSHDSRCGIERRTMGVTVERSASLTTVTRGEAQSRTPVRAMSRSYSGEKSSALVGVWDFGTTYAHRV
jgi:hypothetical protein